MRTYARIGGWLTLFAWDAWKREPLEHANDPRRWMGLPGATELQDFSGRGTEVGCHGMTRPELPELGSQMLAAEVWDGRRVLGELLGEETEDGSR